MMQKSQNLPATHEVGLEHLITFSYSLATKWCIG